MKKHHCSKTVNKSPENQLGRLLQIAKKSLANLDIKVVQKQIVHYPALKWVYARNYVTPSYTTRTSTCPNEQALLM